METDDELKQLSYDDLKTEYKMTDKQIAKMDRESQKIMGNAIVMIDGALRDREEKPVHRIATALTFINITMDLIEKNFNEVLSHNIPKEELN
tara:strand:+ start:224 stop:499 length:276 start_codon:yes stop_codon:yes gene_type:complete